MNKLVYSKFEQNSRKIKKLRKLKTQTTHNFTDQSYTGSSLT